MKLWSRVPLFKFTSIYVNFRSFAIRSSKHLKRARCQKYSTINVSKFLPASNCSKKTCRNQINIAVETETIDIFFLDALCKVQCSSFHTWLEGRFLQGDCLIWLICIPFAAFPLIFPERALSTWRLKSDALSLPFL